MPAILQHACTACRITMQQKQRLTLDPCLPSTSHSPLVMAISSLMGHLKSPANRDFTLAHFTEHTVTMTFLLSKLFCQTQAKNSVALQRTQTSANSTANVRAGTKHSESCVEGFTDALKLTPGQLCFLLFFSIEKGAQGISGVKNGEICFGLGSSSAFIKWLHLPWNEGD